MGEPVARTTPLYECLQRLGIGTAHFATRGTDDLAPVLATHPEIAASVSLVGSARVNPATLKPHASRTLFVRGDHGPDATVFERSGLGSLGAHEHVLASHEDVMWADTAAAHSEELTKMLLAFWDRCEQSTPLPSFSAQVAKGEIAGMAFEISGSGTPVVLLPLFLAPSQWDPVVAELGTRHCVIRLSGAELEPASSLEYRARSGYLRLVQGVLQDTRPQPGEHMLEVGCGTGVLVRWLAQYTASRNPIAALDISPFLLGIARREAEKAGVASSITFHQGSAEGLPFPEQAFDVTYSSTVMEEVNADRMLAEMVRVTRSGGRVAVIVRATDIPGWTSLPLPGPLRVRIQDGEITGGAVSAGGCADASLYQRFERMGLQQVVGHPQFAFANPGMPYWPARMRGISRRLNPSEQEEWDAALEAAKVAGAPIWVGNPFHCAIGVRP